MLETLRNAWRVPELRKKLHYTFFMLLLFRLVGVIPVAGIDLAKMADQIKNYDALGLVNMMTGNQFGQATIMAMGITPYINASIIMQLLTVAIPALERLQKDGGEEGRKKINRITRYSTVGLAALQAIGIIAGLDVSFALPRLAAPPMTRALVEPSARMLAAPMPFWRMVTFLPRSAFTVFLVLTMAALPAPDSLEEPVDTLPAMASA